MAQPSVRALMLDFDMTLFDTSADNDVRKSKKGKDIVWDDVFAVIPEYKLYEEWREVFQCCKNKNIKIAIISTAKGELIKRTLKHFGIPCDAVIGWQLYHRKPSGKLVDMALKKINVDRSEVLSIGDAMIDKEMSYNGGVRFVGALWGSCEKDNLSSGDCILDQLRY